MISEQLFRSVDSGIHEPCRRIWQSIIVANTYKTRVQRALFAVY